MRTSRRRALLVILLALGMVFGAHALLAQFASHIDGADSAAIKRMVTRGLAKTVIDNLFACAANIRSFRKSPVGEIAAEDGTLLVVPAPTAYASGRKLVDLYNDCSGVTPVGLSDMQPDKVPLVEMDPDGEVITGFIVADNYFELYVNGKLVGVDPIPYTPFNSAVVRFRAKRPVTYALKLVDWEERLGLGMETNQGNDWHAGDGGLIARFSDGTVTGASWKAQSFYIAPLAQASDVVENGNIHDTGKLGRVYPGAKLPDCREQCAAVHYPVPDNWAAADFDDNRWPAAFEFTGAEVGVDHIPAYTRYPKALAPARWIWSQNLVLDNLVLVRKTAP